jgi:thymidylate synthase ThyX
MTTITANIIADSISPEGIRLTTMQLRYPKWIHGEFMTHRVFSRNASSSRAIPVPRLIQDVLDDPAFPVRWTSNRSGMQGGEELADPDLFHAKNFMKIALEDAVQCARQLHKLNASKQLINRVLEPFCHINVVVTATDWDNFFALRCHPMAEPHMEMLANAMRDARNESTPVPLKPGEWHLPYVSPIKELNLLPSKPEGGFDDKWAYELMVKLSVARCARVSYLTHEGKTPDIAADLALYDRLVGSVPLHASPAEHQATPGMFLHHLRHDKHWADSHLHGNFRGWVQFRKTLPNENIAA